jgi:hypothetical protein
MAKTKNNKNGYVTKAEAKKMIKSSETKARERNFIDEETGTYTANGDVSSRVSLDSSLSYVILNDNIATTQTTPAGDAQPSPGQRTAQNIYIRGIQSKGQFKLPSGAPEAYVKIALVLFKRPPGHTAGTISSELPDYMVFNDLNGYRPAIEQLAEMKQSKRLKQQVYKLKHDARNDVELQNFSMQYWFKKPIKITYDIDDLDGDNPDYTLLFVCITNDTPTEAEKVQIVSQVRTFYFTE